MTGQAEKLRRWAVTKTEARQRGRLRRKAVVGAVIAAAAFAAAACSSSAGSSAGGAVASASAVTSVTIAYPTLSIHILPLQLGITDGIFAKHHLSVKLVSLSNSQTVVAGLASGSVQYAGVSAAGLLTAASKGANVESVLAYDNGVPLQLVVSKAFADQHSLRPGADIATVVKDLQHTTLGVNGLTDEGVARQLLNSYGADPSTVRYAQLSSAAAQLTELEKGGIDWILLSPPNSYQLQSTNAGYILGSAANIQSWPSDISNFVLAADPAYAAAHATVTKELVAAVNEAVAFVAKNPSQAESVASQEFPSVSRADLLESIKGIAWAVDGTQTQQLWQRTIAFNAKTGSLDSGTTAVEGKTWTNEYYTAASGS
jgi:NitT/TauT family transport system substrate-binding protein